ncbi:MAG: 5-oxoprolinase subunit PxpA [Gammaproteobacteria bacterium]
MKTQIDLNCDLGEGEPLSHTEALMRSISSCNVACGGHFGDEKSMRETAQLAKRYKIAVGAHPSFPDRANFGRRVQPIDETGLRALLVTQVGALKEVLHGIGVPLHHVKLHGALYNLVENDESLARIYVAWAKQKLSGIPLVALADGAVARVAKNSGVRVAREFFADRAYNEDGTLVSRSNTGAVLSDVAEICERVVRAVKEGRVAAATGKILPVEAETVCVHGDSPGAAQIVGKLRTALEAAGVKVRAF